MDKATLSERDICTKFITPALRQAGWDEMLQIREEVTFTKTPHYRTRQAREPWKGEARGLYPVLQAQYSYRHNRGER